MTAAAGTGKRLIRSKSGLRIIPLNENDRSPFELSEPAWIPDDESLNCMECKEEFGFIKRRHHCRRCGRVCCATCCRSRLALPRMCFLDPVRLCSPCAATTTVENRFYHHHLKALLSGAILTLAGEEWEGGSNLTSCCLSADHRFVQMHSTDASLCLPVHHITAVHTSKNKTNSESEDGPESSGTEDITSSTGDSGGGTLFSTGGVERDAPLCNCVVLTYKTGGGNEGESLEAEVSLSAPDDAAPSAFSFLRALLLAATMAIEARHVIGTGN